MNIFHKIILATTFVICLSATANPTRKGFAVVIDPISQQKAQTELQEYIKALEKTQNFKVYTLTDRWGIPDSIRAVLISLYSQKEAPIIGAVFIGDIPIPMVRDAQHLCSAFKMSQKMPWLDSSVPSDRFYDDFGLKFKYLKRDSLNPQYFYYSLSADGSQVLRPNIFSGRIRPTDAGGTSRYQKLRSYLSKTTQAKLHPEDISTLFVYTGSGSLSESKVAHIDEMKSMHEHFPSLAHNPHAFSYMDYSDAPYIKQKVMNELMRPDLSIALMHHHGDYDTQYLSAYPAPQDAAQAMQYMLRCYRARLSRGLRMGKKSLDSLKLEIVNQYNIPAEWLKDYDESELNRLDSIDNSMMNLTLPDFAAYGFQPNCRLMFYDACYNGSFHRDDCIANEYIFQPGRTVAGLGGTVNVLQDKWPDRYIGLLNRGLMVGYLNMYNPDLEMHVIGDPTFAFRQNESGDNINGLMTTASDKMWLSLLNDKGTHPDLQCMALEKLKKSSLLSNEKLLNLLQSSAYDLVRMQAFLTLQSRGYSPAFVKGLNIAANDNFELLQRFAVNSLIKCGTPEVIPTFARLLALNNASARVEFNALQGTQFFDGEKLLAAVNKVLDSIGRYVTQPDEYRAAKLKEINKYINRWDKDINSLCEGKLTPRRAALQANFMRIYLPAFLADKVALYTETQTSDPQLQKDLLEALGWHRLGYKSSVIKEVSKRMSTNPDLTPEVREEALKTLKRISGE